MPRRRTKGVGVSPYTKQNKAPYRYKFPTCSHNHAVRQSVVGSMPHTPHSVRWSGLACSVCNIILSTYPEDDPKYRIGFPRAPFRRDFHAG